MAEMHVSYMELRCYVGEIISQVILLSRKNPGHQLTGKIDPPNRRESTDADEGARDSAFLLASHEGRFIGSSLRRSNVIPKVLNRLQRAALSPPFPAQP
jgi:hypothetical protein